MTPKEKVIPSAIKWMTKLAATMTQPQPKKYLAGGVEVVPGSTPFFYNILLWSQRTSVRCQVDVILFFLRTLAGQVAFADAPRCRFCVIGKGTNGYG